MRATQVSAFLENRPGRLLHLLQVLAEANVNLVAHNIVDASDFGIVHMLVDDSQHALEVMRSANMTCSTTTVLQVNVPDEPGAFATQVLQPLAEAGVNIEYSYAYSDVSCGAARIILKVDNVAKAEQVLGALA